MEKKRGKDEKKNFFVQHLPGGRKRKGSGEGITSV